MSVQEIEAAIEQLPPDDLAALAAWFAEHRAATWDARIVLDPEGPIGSRSGRSGKEVAGSVLESNAKPLNWRAGLREDDTARCDNGRVLTAEQIAPAERHGDCEKEKGESYVFRKVERAGYASPRANRPYRPASKPDTTPEPR